MIDQFDGDIAFILTNDGGKIFFSGGQPIMDVGGLENAVNISLFTGLGWWGNGLFENEPDKQIGSDFETRLKPKAITTAYLRDIEDAAKTALQWLMNIKAADIIDIEAIWLEVNYVNINILITKPDGETVSIKYELNWEAGFAKQITANIKA